MGALQAAKVMLTRASRGVGGILASPKLLESKTLRYPDYYQAPYEQAQMLTKLYLGEMGAPDTMMLLLSPSQLVAAETSEPSRRGDDGWAHDREARLLQLRPPV